MKHIQGERMKCIYCGMSSKEAKNVLRRTKLTKHIVICKDCYLMLLKKIDVLMDGVNAIQNYCSDVYAEAYHTRKKAIKQNKKGK